MQITITARHFELTTPVKQYAEKAIRGLKKYFDQIIIADMVLRVEKNRNVAELNIKVKKLNLICKARDKDMYVAIDNAVKKMERQIKRYIGKMQRHHPTKNIGLKNIPAQKIASQPVITRKKVVPALLNIDKAVEELIKSGKDHVFFRNIENNKINFLKKEENFFELSEIE
jgi:putative sigma-54 modulation protein